MSKPRVEEDIIAKSFSFFNKDLYSSPRYRESSYDKNMMNVRFEGSNVLPRSICGNRNQFI